MGVLAAMVTHAAGESAVRYGPWFSGATAVVLEAKDEANLKSIRSYLHNEKIDFVEVHETGGPYNGQFMAIGLRPVERETIAEKMKGFQTLKTCELTCAT